MVAVLVEEDPYPPVAALTGVVDDLLAMSFTSLSTRDLPALARAVETQLRRLPVFDHALNAEMQRRDVAREVGGRDTAKVLVDALRIAPGEARARVKAATNLGPRHGFGGEPLPPLFPHLSSAQADGAVSVEHAKVITTTIDRLPSAIRAEHADAVEAALVGHAHDFDPGILAGLARRIRDHLDPDGTLTDADDRHRCRRVTFHQRPEGSARGTLDLTPAYAAKWQTLFDCLAKPVKADDGVRDPRTADQRRHDAMEAIADLLLRSGDLSNAGGTPATVIVTITLDQLQDRTGLATTAHAGTTSAAEAMIREMRHLPEHLRRSITWDRGTEMADYARIQLALEAKLYFCDPHSPWQRGTNENTNRLLRFWFEKGSDLSGHTAADLRHVADTLNKRPRPTLDLETPVDRLNKLLLAA